MVFVILIIRPNILIDSKTFWLSQIIIMSENALCYLKLSLFLSFVCCQAVPHKLLVPVENATRTWPAFF